MKEKQKITKYQSGNKKTETYLDGETSITKHYYDAKDAFVREFISVVDGVKQVKQITAKGVTAKLEHFVGDKREGQEVKYFVSKADGSIKSTKIYADGKLHGENITCNEKGEIIKHEVFAMGRKVVKYLRNSDDNNEVTSVEILDEDGVENLPKVEYDKLQTYVKSLPNHTLSL